MVPPAASDCASAPVAVWDVFLSYSRTDADKARSLARALRSRGLRVFLDDMAVDDFASITASISDALARSKVLLALYSADYPRRRACQWELTYAYLAGQRKGDPRSRVLVINPERSVDHVQPVELRDARHWNWPTVPDALRRLAEQVAAHVTGVESPLGSVGLPATGSEAASTPWLPAPARSGSVRFTDRLAEQWRIHSALVRHRAPLVAQPGSGSGRTAQLRGMPGIGKSVLAQEYALRFGSAYPGGVYWFDLHRTQSSLPTTAMEVYAEQVAVVCHALGVDHTDGTSLVRLLSRLAIHLGEHGMPCLWVVDGVPDGLNQEELQLLHGPHLLASTLLTTRSFRYGSSAEAIDVPPLSDADGYRLITARRTPGSDVEKATALALVHDVGGHPHALDLLSDLADTSDFSGLRNRLHAAGTDILVSPGPPLARSSTPEHTRIALAATLLTRPLSGKGPVDDVLRFFALASPTPLSQTVLENAVASVDPYDPWEAGPAVSDALATLLGSGALLPDPIVPRSWTVHALLARAVRRHDEDTARQEDLRQVLLHTLAAPLTRTSGDSLPPRPAPMPFPPLDLPRSGPGPVERAAAFDLQVELVTRVGVQPLGPEDGSLREALTSLHSLFATTREVLHRVAAESPPPLVIPRIAFVLANQHLRPFLATWHSALRRHEDTCPPGRSALEHEQLWSRAADMRAQLADLREPLTSTAEELAALCGIDLLHPAGPENK
ncbi:MULTISPECIES: TIR domain-containing protein [unclassified Streptomyces]|uniref:TIR domain-containing protein n=1 Tax=Streptomyces sp. AC1-42T TaxID=2218665 RepID=UPI000DAD7B6B|nr:MULTISPECIES: TIR domain-containing protein [unclassified Streptomyces]PZT72981.1 toll/interleukin-1 receptor domain-containing protein [Streptomyces sp. AC1-42T]PZT83717.1 toll/interleukin-1 receptor domain-containing protein [Streptomyces sp. AC1-42W]